MVSSGELGFMVLWKVSIIYEQPCIFLSRREASKLNTLPSQDRNVDTHTSKLMYAVFINLPLLGLRLAYGIAYLQLKISHPTSGFLTSKAVQVCLSVVPEMLITTIFLFVGVMTRNLKHEIKKLDSALPVGDGYEIHR